MLEKSIPAGTTLDGLLNQHITLEQPAVGYRVAIDTVLMAAAVPAKPGEKVLELGCGVGGAMLCLAVRVPGVAVLGLDIQSEYVLLCRDNIVRNKLKGDLKVQVGDATQLSLALAGVFHQVMINPPYHDEAQHDASAHAQKRTSNTEKSGDLALWITSAAAALKTGGVLTLINRADREKEILGVLKAFGTVDVCALVPKSGAEPKRIIIRARKGVTGGLRKSEFILHQADGRYTDQAEDIFRNGVALAF